MPQCLEIDVDRLMEQIAASRTRRIWASSPSQVTALHASSQELPDLSFLQSGYDVYHVDFSARFASHLQQQALHLQQQLDAVRNQQATDLEVLRQEIEALTQQQSAALQALRTELTDQLQSLREQLEDGLPEGRGQRRGLDRSSTH